MLLKPLLPGEYDASKRYRLVHVPTEEARIQSPIYGVSDSAEELLAALPKLKENNPELGVLDVEEDRIL